MIRSFPVAKARTLLMVIGRCVDPSLGQGCSSFVFNSNGYAVFGTNYGNSIRRPTGRRSGRRES